MKDGEFILKRWLVDAVRTITNEVGITLTTYSDDWLLELQKDDTTKRVIGYKFDINAAVAAECASDKVTTSIILGERGIPTVEHILVRTKATNNDHWYQKEWSDVVVKPLSGTGGHGVRRFSHADDAEAYMSASGIEAWAVAPYYEIKTECRLIILDAKILLAYRKEPVQKDDLKMFNLGLGATPTDIAPTLEQTTLALHSMEALGLRLASVDIIETVDGQMKILEINDGIMMEHYSRVSPQHKQRALEAYRAIVHAMMA